ncbi:MAG: prepilin-type N-terminal cleavage/methylation domain-containing protein [Deltaproteobacteria bacterium]
MSTRIAQDRAGYTLVEVMVALGLLGVGVTGILSMENAAILANRRAQEMTLATNIARRWQERLREDSLMWNAPSNRTTVSDLGTDTVYLCRLAGCGGGSAAAGQWLVPTPPAGSTESPAYDAFGNEIAVGPTAVRYCVNVRYNWLRADAAARQGMIRTEVRVWWYREGAVRQASYANCGNAAGLAAMGTDRSNVEFVYLVSALTGNPL